MLSSQTSKTGSDSGETSLMSPISSVKSKTPSRGSSRKSSPALEESKNSRRRSNRLSLLEVSKEKELEDAKKRERDVENGVELVLKRKKLMKNDKLPFEQPTPSASGYQNKNVIVTLKDGRLEFNEPIATEPIMSVTGLPLSAPPNAKIKKESLWPRKRSKKKGTDNSKVQPLEEQNTTENFLDDQSNSASAEPDDVEERLRKGLKTAESEKIQKESNTRSKNVNPVAKKGARKYTKKLHKSKNEETSIKLPKNKQPNGKEKEDGRRKIKNASPKKIRENPFGFDNPIRLAGQPRENAFDFADNTKDNQDFCASCGEPGIFLCCEACPKSFHFACCDPPLDEDSLPEGNWYCKECLVKRNPPKPHPRGLFAKLLNQIDLRNPIQFKLPKKIRDRFEGVSTGQFGEYEDDNYKPYKPQKIGSFEQTDPDHHFDKNGRIIYCSKCGESGINSDKLNGGVDKLIIICEYCQSPWHLDCLDPPLSTVKQLGKKWKCPNHIDDLIPSKQRRLKRPHIVDVDQTYGYKNNGDIDIKLDDSGDEAYSGVVNIPTPPFLNNHDTSNGVAAAIPKQHLKLYNDSYFIHRVPERGILVDFMNKIHDSKEKEQAQRINEVYRITRENNQLLNTLTNDESYSGTEKSTIKSLVDLKESNFKSLIQAATQEIQKHSQNLRVDDISNEELEELLQVKKLLMLKGKAEVLNFLKH